MDFAGRKRNCLPVPLSVGLPELSLPAVAGERSPRDESVRLADFRS